MPLSQPLPHSEEMEMTVGRNPAMTPEDITSPALVSCQLLKPTDGFLFSSSFPFLPLPFFPLLYPVKVCAITT